MANKPKLQLAEKDTELSMERGELSKHSTMLSATRTLLSYIRTTLVFISLAFAFMKLDKQNPVDAFTITLFVLSGLFLIAGIIDFACQKHFVNSLNSDEKKEKLNKKLKNTLKNTKK